MTGVTNTTDRTYGMSTSALATALTPPNAARRCRLPTGVTLSSWSVTALTPLLANTTDPNGRPTLEDGTNSTLRVRVYYRASAVVQYSTLIGHATATLQRIFYPRRTKISSITSSSAPNPTSNSNPAPTCM